MKLRDHLPSTLLLGAAVLAAAGYGWFAVGGEDAAPEYATAVVARGDIEDTVSALGMLQPREFVDVGTQVSGQLKTVRVAIGDTVERGTLVAEIDPAVFAAKIEAGQATLSSLEAQIAEKRAQYQLANRQYQRNTAMFRENAGSKDAVDISAAAREASRAQIAMLRAQQNQTRANLKVEQANLGYTHINAPMSGTVVALSARVGQTLNANQQAPIILRVANLDTMTVVAQVSEVDVVQIKPGVKAYFSTLGRPDRRWSGEVRQILPTPETINNVVLYHVLFDVDNADHELRMEMSAQVFFIMGQAKNALLVPAAALQQRKRKASDKRTTDAILSAMAEDAPAGDEPAQAADGKASAKRSHFVQVLKDGQISMREVVVGVMNRESAQIVSGVEAGEEIVVGAESDRKRKKKSAGERSAKP